MFPDRESLAADATARDDGPQDVAALADELDGLRALTGEEAIELRARLRAAEGRLEALGERVAALEEAAPAGAQDPALVERMERAEEAAKTARREADLAAKRQEKLMAKWDAALATEREARRKAEREAKLAAKQRRADDA